MSNITNGQKLINNNTVWNVIDVCGDRAVIARTNGWDRIVEELKRVDVGFGELVWVLADVPRRAIDDEAIFVVW